MQVNQPPIMINLQGYIPRIIINKHYSKQFLKLRPMSTNKFIVKLIQMMRQFPQIINWSADGKEIDILDVQNFSSEVHSKYFTTSNYQSFLRQLNMYSFKKMSKRKNSVSFRHQDFHRDNFAAFSNIKRRKQKTPSMQSRPEKEVSSVMEEPTSTLSAPQLDHEIRDTIALIRKEISPTGLHLLARLQELLQKSIGNWIGSQSKLTDHPASKEDLREYASFCKIQEQMLQKAQCYASAHSQFNFQSQIFHQGTYLEE